MKVTELLAKRTEVVSLIRGSKDYFGRVLLGEFGEGSGENVESKEELQKAFDTDAQLLRKLDTINNTLFEVDAKTYIEVMGNRLSVATAREYIRELRKVDDDDFMWDSINTFVTSTCNSSFIGSTENMRYYVLDKCTRAPFKANDKNDPLRLHERTEEFEKKELRWCLDLITAVAMSDATTEVAYHE